MESVQEAVRTLRVARVLHVAMYRDRSEMLAIQSCRVGPAIDLNVAEVMAYEGEFPGLIVFAIQNESADSLGLTKRSRTNLALIQNFSMKNGDVSPSRPPER